MNVKFGLVVLIVLPFMILCIVLRLTKSAPVFAKLQKQVDEINNIMQEDVAGIRIIKACVKEIYEKVRFGKANDELVRTHLKALFLFAFVNPVVNSIMYIAIAAILLISSYEVSTGGITPGDILGILEGKIVSVDSSVDDSVFNLLDAMVDDDNSVITLFYGDEVCENDAELLKKQIEERYEDCDVYVHFGGQPVYYYFISVE